MLGLRRKQRDMALLSVTDTHEHITAVVTRDPGGVMRGWCICGWWGPERYRTVHITLDRKAHVREAMRAETQEA